MALAQPGPMILPGARNVDVDNLEYKSAGRDIHGPTINLTIASPPEISSRSLFEEIRSLLGLFSDHTGPTDEPRSRHELKAGSPSVKSIPSLKVLDLDHDLASAASPDTSKNVMTSGPARDAQRELNTSESVRSNPRAPSEVDDATENEDFKARYTSELDPRPLEGLTTPQIYVYSMLGSGRGLACWKPCTHNSVSSRRRVFPSISDSESTAGWGGVIPGDVGTYDAERGFSKVFNLWEDDEAIRSMAKDIYQRIYTTPDDDIKISESDFRRGDTVAQGASAEVNDSGDGEFIEGFEFQVHPGSSQGALLAVTSAADQLEIYDHKAKAWAKRVIDWAIAAWRESMVAPNDRLKLLRRTKIPVEKSSLSAGNSYRWTHRGTAEARVGSSGQHIKDQCLFLQGYTLDFSASFRARMKRHILPSGGVNLAPPGNPKGGGGSSGSGGPGSNFSFGTLPQSGTPGSETGGGSDQNTGEGHLANGSGGSSGSNLEENEHFLGPSPVDGVQVTPFPDITRQRTCHPSDVITDYILHKTGAEFALAHDDDWRFLLQKFSPDEKLGSREVSYRQGVAFLMPKTLPTEHRQDELVLTTRQDVKISASSGEATKLNEVEGYSKHWGKGRLLMTDISFERTVGIDIESQTFIELCVLGIPESEVRKSLALFMASPGRWEAKGIIELPTETNAINCILKSVEEGNVGPFQLDVRSALRSPEIRSKQEPNQKSQIYNEAIGLTMSCQVVEVPSTWGEVPDDVDIAAQFQDIGNERLRTFARTVELSDIASSLEELQDNDFPACFAERNGRLYPSEANSVYRLPVDTPEQERYTVNHTMLKRILGVDYQGATDSALTPDPTRLRRVLDLCCGNGKWLLDMAIRAPHAQFVGVDIVPIATRYPPDNVQFELLDVNTDLRWDNEHFDLVHARDVLMAVKDYDVLLHEVARLLRPGGQFLSVEWSNQLAVHISFPGNIEDIAPATVHFFDTAHHILAEQGVDIDGSRVSANITTSNYFTNTNIRKIYVPVGTWCQNAQMDEIGSSFRTALKRMARGFRQMFLDYGLSDEEVDVLTAAFIQEIQTVEGLVAFVHITSAERM